MKILNTLICLGLVIPSMAVAQTARLPYKRAPSDVRTTPFSDPRDVIVTRNTQIPVSVERVENPGAQWQQIKFGNYHLGEQSYVRIVGVSNSGDRISQILTAEQMLLYEGESAYFDSDKLDVELYVARGDEGVFFEIDDVSVGQSQQVYRETPPSELGTVEPETETATETEDDNESVGDSELQSTSNNNQEALCTPGQDRRERVQDERVGRIVPVGCTGWIIGENAFLTAGHCVGSEMGFLQFNVPESATDGTVGHPRPRDQYKINLQSLKFANGGEGRDWAIFAVVPNSNSGKLPLEVQGEKFNLAIDPEVSRIAVNGFGVDDVPLGAPPPFNNANQTLQGHSGELLGYKSSAKLTYLHKADTKVGNSGSPMIALNDAGEELGYAIGIHSHGGCSPSESDGNKGTSFLNEDLANAVQEFLGEEDAFLSLE